MIDDTPPFKSAHAAVIFAFNYAHQQSPKTPMTALLRGPAGASGAGLSGLDGAAQAGMILRAIDALTHDQRAVLVVRFGDFRSECPCCGQPAPSQDWREAMAYLASCADLDGLPRAVKLAAIERAVCRRKWDSKRLSEEYGLSVRTLQEQVRRLKGRMTKAENAGLGALDTWLRQGGTVGN